VQQSLIKYLISALVLIVLTLSSGICDEIETDFNRAFNFLNSRQYQQAYDILLNINAAAPGHDRADRHLYFLGKAAYYTERYDQAVRALRNLVTEYPKSEYVPYGYYFLGNAQFRQIEPEGAIEAYLEAYIRSGDDDLNELVLKSIEAASGAITAGSVAAIQNSVIPEGKRCRFLLSLSRALIEQGNYQSVSSMLGACRGQEAEVLTARAQEMLSRNPEIGVVLPLSGEFQKYGEQLLDGIMLAVEQYIAETGGKLEPIIYDSRGETLEAARIVRVLSAGGTAATIGPLTSDAAAVSSGVLACGDMPLIIPAASQGGLTELSATSFQLQPNLDLQGLRMADLARQWLNADTAAIITPTLPENLRMARAFKNRFEELGGTILGVEYFRSRETDFGPYVRDLKSLIIGDLLDSVIFISEEGDTIEAEEVPVWLDCLFIPANADHLRQLLPQIHFYNLNTIYLGGDGWGSETVYGLDESITKECYFSSGLINTQVREAASKFASDFDRRYGRQPGRVEALGYDAMTLLARSFTGGNYSRNAIVDYLKTVRDFEGASGMVTFGKHRENIELPIYKIEDEAPVKVTFEN